MTDPTPIFDPARWAERWHRFGGWIDLDGHVARPLALVMPAETLTWQDCELVRMWTKLAPLHRAALLDWQRDRREHPRYRPRRWFNRAS